MRTQRRTTAQALHLAGQGGDDALCVDQGRVAQVVQAVAAKDLGTGLEPHCLTEGRAVLQAANVSCCECTVLEQCMHQEKTVHCRWYVAHHAASQAQAAT